MFDWDLMSSAAKNVARATKVVSQDRPKVNWTRWGLRPHRLTCHHLCWSTLFWNLFAAVTNQPLTTTYQQLVVRLEIGQIIVGLFEKQTIWGQFSMLFPTAALKLARLSGAKDNSSKRQNFSGLFWLAGRLMIRKSPPDYWSFQKEVVQSESKNFWQLFILTWKSRNCKAAPAKRERRFARKDPIFYPVTALTRVIFKQICSPILRQIRLFLVNKYTCHQT